MSLELMRVVVGACSRSDAPRFRAMLVSKPRTTIRLGAPTFGGLVCISTGSSSRLLVFRLETEAAAAPIAPVGEARLEPLNEAKLAQAEFDRSRIVAIAPLQCCRDTSGPGIGGW
jgi:hypothetical protein